MTESLSSFLSLSRPVAIAHRGGSRLRPENTMAAFEHAAALGVDGLECDVHLSRDDEVVVIHDATLDRTTDGTGPVAAFSADELARVDAGFHFRSVTGESYRGCGHGVPRLADVLQQYPRLPLIVEIKGQDVRVATRAMEVITRAGATERVIIGGFDRAVLMSVRGAFPAVPTSASRSEVQSALRRSYFRMAPRPTGMTVFQVPIRLRGKTVLTRALVRGARRAGYPVHAWIVDEVDDMRRMLDWGVTGLISDRPDLAVPEVRRFVSGATE